MRQHFISVVFFEAVHPQSLLLKSTLSNSTLVKIFTASGKDEIQQIVNMSERTVIVSDLNDLRNLRVREGDIAGLGHSRKYFLDWKLAPGAPAQVSIGEDGVCIIKTNDPSIPIEKFELYLFGCINVFSRPTFVEPTFSKNQNGKYFFTHFSLVGDRWKTIISTHEREKNISELLGKDWEKLVTEVLADAPNYKKIREEVLNKPFYQSIYPHFIDGKLKKLTIAHLVYNAQVQENLARFYKFLETLGS
jgi:hypothetical protein